MTRRPPPSTHVASAFSYERRRSSDGVSGVARRARAWAQPLSKYKTPSDYIVSTFRGLELPVGDGRGALGAFEVLGQRTYSPGLPRAGRIAATTGMARPR